MRGTARLSTAARGARRTGGCPAEARLFGDCWLVARLLDGTDCGRGAVRPTAPWLAAARGAWRACGFSAVAFAFDGADLGPDAGASTARRLGAARRGCSTWRCCPPFPVPRVAPLPRRTARRPPDWSPESAPRLCLCPRARCELADAKESRDATTIGVACRWCGRPTEDASTRAAPAGELTKASITPRLATRRARHPMLHSFLCQVSNPMLVHRQRRTATSA